MHLIVRRSGKETRSTEKLPFQTRGERVQKGRGVSREKRYQFPRTPRNHLIITRKGFFPPVVHHANVMIRKISFPGLAVLARRIKEVVPPTYEEIIIVIRLFRTLRGRRRAGEKGREKNIGKERKGGISLLDGPRFFVAPGGL